MKKHVLALFVTSLILSVSQVNASCDSPTGLASSNVTSTTAVLQWNAVQGATSYRIRYHKSESAAWQAGTSTSNSFHLSNILPGMDYEWQVATVCGYGTSGFSNIKKFTTVPYTINPPAGVTFNNVNATTAGVTWNSSPGICSYYIQWRIVGAANWNTIINVFNPNYSFTGLHPCTQYEFRVRIFCPSSTSMYSSIHVFTTSGCLNPNNNHVSARLGHSENENISDISLYPNPVIDHLTAEYPSEKAGLVTANIYNLIGKNVLSTTVEVQEGNNLINLNTDQLNAGVYFFEIENNGELIRRKFIISK